MTGTVLLFGGLAERDEAERLIAQRSPELRVGGAARPWEAVERAVEGAFDAVVILKGPIAEHDRRMDLIASLARHGFGGRILACGSFLTEKQDALAAGAHYAFDPAQQRIEEVVRRAVVRPQLAADHPYLRALFHGEWAEIRTFGEKLPEPAPAVLLTAVSLHPDEAFWNDLVAHVRANPRMQYILVEDGGDEAAATEALATGLQPYVVLESEGLQRVLALGREFLREAWLSEVSSA
ncbi:MAG: hypothetical protein HRF46_06790 [Acidobacteriota bacterium]|jgi:hypothetical protein